MAKVMWVVRQPKSNLVRFTILFCWFPRCISVPCVCTPHCKCSLLCRRLLARTRWSSNTGHLSTPMENQWTNVWPTKRCPVRSSHRCPPVCKWFPPANGFSIGLLEAAAVVPVLVRRCWKKRATIVPEHTPSTSNLLHWRYFHPRHASNRPNFLWT